MLDALMNLAAMARLKVMLTIALVGALLFGLSGCAILQSFTKKPEQQAAVKIVVTVSVIDLVTKHPEYKEGILSITHGVKQYINGKPEARAADIISLVNSQINYAKLNPEERLIVQTLLVTIQSQLEDKIAKGGVNQDVLVAVGQIIDWVETAAAY